MTSLARLLALALILASVASAAPAPYDAGARWTALALLDEDFDKVAEAAFDEILKSDSRFASDRVNLARARLKQGLSATAIPPLRDARRIDPRSAQAAYFLGVALQRARSTTESVAVLSEALALAPDLPEAHFQLGLAHENSGAPDRAIRAFESAAKLLEGPSRGGLSPRMAKRAAHLAHRHLSLIHMGRNDDAAVEREDTLLQAIDLPDTPADSELDVGPSLPALHPDAPEVRRELTREGLPVPDPPAPASLRFTPGQPAASPAPGSTPATPAATPSALEAGAVSAIALDTGAVTVSAELDADGDLDVVLGGTRGGKSGLFVARNASRPVTGPLELVELSHAQCSLTTALPAAPVGLTAADLDDDNSVDIVAFVPGHSPIAFLNQRQDRFQRREFAGPPATGPGCALDADGDGSLELAYPAGSAIAMVDSSGQVHRQQLATGDVAARVTAADLDMDGQLDLLVATAAGPTSLLLARGVPGQPAFETYPERFPGAPGDVLTALDLDGDGDNDLQSPTGATWTSDASARGSIRVSLRGTTGKAPPLGTGSKLWVRAGGRLTRRDVTGSTELIGLGGAPRADLVRVLWTDGTVQHHLGPVDRPSERTRVPAGTHITIPQRAGFGGSCPYLYVKRDGHWEFVTDVLAGAPLGLPSPNGGYLPVVDEELVLLPPTSAASLELRVTEELREVTFLDHAKLLVIDHPPDVSPVPAGGMTDPGPPRLVPLRALTPPREARTLDGADVTELVGTADGRMTEPPTTSVQGLAPENGLELRWPARAGGDALWLVLEGMVYWTDAGINTRLAQSDPAALRLPLLEVPDARGGWRQALFPLPFPAGRTKLAAVDVSTFIDPSNPRLRLRTTMRFYWDRISLASRPPPSAVPLLQIRELIPAGAHCLPVPFSRLLPDPAQAPWTVDTARPHDRLEADWQPPRGHYTRFGPIPTLLDTMDDRYAILGPGDGVDLHFDIPKPVEGFTRTLALHVGGWDKDGHPATFGSATVAPLPYRGMPAYRPGSAFPPERQRSLHSGLRDTATRFRTPRGAR